MLEGNYSIVKLRSDPTTIRDHETDDDYDDDLFSI